MSPGQPEPAKKPAKTSKLQRDAVGVSNRPAVPSQCCLSGILSRVPRRGGNMAGEKMWVMTRTTLKHRCAAPRRPERAQATETTPALAGRAWPLEAGFPGRCPGLMCPHAVGVQNVQTPGPGALTGRATRFPRGRELRACSDFGLLSPLHHGAGEAVFPTLRGVPRPFRGVFRVGGRAARQGQDGQGEQQEKYRARRGKGLFHCSG